MGVDEPSPMGAPGVPGSGPVGAPGAPSTAKIDAPSAQSGAPATAPPAKAPIPVRDPVLLPPIKLSSNRAVRERAILGGKAAGREALRRLGLADVTLAGRSYNSGRKALEDAGFVADPTTSTGRKVFTNPRTGAQVFYDSGRALARGQSPHWHIRDVAGNAYNRSGRIVDSSENAGHIPGR
jgi:hypothetical protein